MHYNSIKLTLIYDTKRIYYKIYKKKWKIKKTGGEKMYMYWAPLSQKPGPSENQKSKIAKKKSNYGDLLKERKWGGL